MVVGPRNMVAIWACCCYCRVTFILCFILWALGLETWWPYGRWASKHGGHMDVGRMGVLGLETWWPYGRVVVTVV
ncbi:hypothetical protein FRX31_008291 [Thalictrum thalictroides]|uniref:Transmembrane protein n=1 Tax=Thalictrum thalictroides TaxID=46969 RepID=A0A7J6WXD8_THATH|nr:hypothetical protein FRX31_008291 [Thalictrum thalictroides]